MADLLTKAKEKIRLKRISLKNKGFNIGKAKSRVIDVAYGGFYQDFENGRIYSHPSVGTFEVHGGILKKYKSRGEFGRSPFTLRRELGFPTSDEKSTPEGYPLSTFEWGEIIYFPDTNGGIAISGSIYKTWNISNKKTYGYPITSNISNGRNEFICFEKGICIYNKSISLRPIWIKLNFPLLGNPGIIDNAIRKLPINFVIDSNSFNLLGGISGFNKIIDGRLNLVEVNKKSSIIALKIATATRSNIGFIKRITLHVSPLQPSPLRRFDQKPKLFDLVFKNETNKFYNLSPHCLYSRKNWKDFGLIHITDVHVAKRIDSFRSKFTEAKRKYPRFSQQINDAINSLNNWNNGFRDLIRYANDMYKKGIVDGIIATGDMVDYLFEENDNKNGGGNFEFFKQIILGKSPYPDMGRKVEELLVPIFITLGNHDYRVNPYYLYGRVNIKGFIIGIPDKDIPQFKPYNLLKREARILQNGNPNKFNNDDEGRIKFSGKKATEQVIPTTEIKYWEKDYLGYYKKYINESVNSVTNLGIHKLILLDSRSDKGAPDGKNDSWDALAASFGILPSSEDEEAFYAGHPNTKGPDQNAYNLLKTHINNSQGIIIVGIHAPIINIVGNEYPHYFRETEHKKIDQKEIFGFILRHKMIPVFNGQNIVEVVTNNFQDWLSRSSFFTKGKLEPLITEGVSRGKMNLFLKLISGLEGSKKPIELLLCGHDHTMAEIRIKWKKTNNYFEYYTDFYTENPSRYYNSKTYKGGQIKISVVRGAGINELVATINEGTSKVKHLKVPVYHQPLNKSVNKNLWWNSHKPILIQGAPLGPTDKNNRTRKKGIPSNTSFEGCKLIIIRKDVINSISQISRNELSKQKYTIPSDVKKIEFGSRPLTSINIRRPIVNTL